MTKRLLSAGLVTLLSISTLFTSAVPAAKAAGKQVQITFSDSLGDTFNYVTPPTCLDPSCSSPESANFDLFGFWIWCSVAASPGGSSDCAGSMYFAGESGIAFAVDGTASGSGNTYTMVVHSKDDHIICSLTNLSAKPGRSNPIQVTCASPAGSATTSNAIASISAS
jgi:hypothetical protein